MTDNKILQAILDGQVLIREDLSKFKTEVVERFDKVGERIDKLGLQIASLEVEKLEKQFVSA